MSARKSGEFKRVSVWEFQDDFSGLQFRESCEVAEVASLHVSEVVSVQVQVLDRRQVLGVLHCCRHFVVVVVPQIPFKEQPMIRNTITARRFEHYLTYSTVSESRHPNTSSGVDSSVSSFPLRCSSHKLCRSQKSSWRNSAMSLLPNHLTTNTHISQLQYFITSLRRERHAQTSDVWWLRKRLERQTVGLPRASSRRESLWAVVERIHNVVCIGIPVTSRG